MRYRRCGWRRAAQDANLVVKIDAEQGIIARREAETRWNQAGVIQGRQIRDKIRIDLEGGEKAFNKRALRCELHNKDYATALALRTESADPQIRRWPKPAARNRP
jgi:hypothetical protein